MASFCFIMEQERLAQEEPPRPPATVLPYALTIFVSAFLLFQLQPLIAKYILPWFGGGPTVWTTCMLFFQVFLLAGYGYAHVSVLKFSARIQAAVHGALLAAALFQLPITPAADWKPLSSFTPTSDILLLLGACVGFPYFVLASTTPLMQAWFSREHPGVSPYRLYALSNAGSLLALLSYPFVFEPMLTRSQQSRVWGGGFWIFFLASIICAWGAWRRGATKPAAEPAPGMAAQAVPRPSAGTVTLWLLLPACAAVLLLAVTNQITMDLIVVPFLWVLPLSLYLLTFILCFEGERWYSRRIFVSALLPVLIAALTMLWEKHYASVVTQIVSFSLILFVCCMICHGELSRLKPHPRYLTGYYLMIALGGALGGVFVTLIAPFIFIDYFEFHVGLLGTGALCFIALYADKRSWFHAREVRWTAIPLLVCYGIVVVLFIVQARGPLQSAIVQTRNFYGILSVLQFARGLPDEQLHLRHGRILHGAQFTAPDKRGWATGYYADDSGAGLALRYFPRKRGRRIGLVGLGVGTLVSFAREGDRVKVYEINPEIRRLAESYFTYLKDSPAEIEIVMGDARLSLEREPPQAFDILLLDAFSGDAIPVHLLTVEAFETYLRHLKPDGVLGLLIDTFHLDFEPVVRRLAEYFDLQAIRIDSAPGLHQDWGARWMLLAWDEEFLLSPPLAAAATHNSEEHDHVRLWTDEYTSLLPLLDFQW